MDWKTVRFDPTYNEPLDPEIIPLCDALNAAGFETTSSCWGHGHRWPHVWFKHSDDKRIESLARFVKSAESGSNRPFFSVWQKEIQLDGYAWCVEIHLNQVFADTTATEGAREALAALERVTARVNE